MARPSGTTAGQIATRSWSLGDPPPPGYRLIREVYPLPQNREQLAALIQEILNLGMVQRLTVQTRQPIVSLRLVKESEADPTMDEIVVQDLLDQARNAEMLDFSSGVESVPLRVLYEAFQVLLNRRLTPRALLVHDVGALQDWLEVERTEYLPVLFGVMVYEDDEIPNDVLLLTAVNQDDADSVALSLRIPMDIPKGDT